MDRVGPASEAAQIRRVKVLDGFPPPKHAAGYTYQELAPEFGVDARTVARWFRNYILFRPTQTTARVPREVLAQFIQDSGKKLKGKT